MQEVHACYQLALLACTPYAQQLVSLHRLRQTVLLLRMVPHRILDIQEAKMCQGQVVHAGCYNFSDGLMPYQWTRVSIIIWQACL